MLPAPFNAKTPLEISVAPVNVLAFAKVKVPAPICRISPVPSIRFETETASERLKLKIPLLVTTPEPRLPDVPPLPTCRVPAATVVLP